MAKNKTTETELSVTDFINAVADESKRKDSFELVKIMESQTGLPAKMWGSAIVGFGSYHYKYDSGHEGVAPLVGFSPRKAAISLYVFSSFEKGKELLARFGKYKVTDAGGCIYIKKLTDIDTNVLREMITEAVKEIKNRYPG